MCFVSRSKHTQVVCLSLLDPLNQSPEGCIGRAHPVVAPHIVVPGEQQKSPGQHRYEEHGSYGHSPMEGDGCGKQEAQVKGDALERQAGAATLEEAVVPGYVACQLHKKKMNFTSCSTVTPCSG